MKRQDHQPHSGSASFTDFIRHHQAAILADWERKARAQLGAQALARPVLVDHLPALLSGIAKLIEQIEAGSNDELSQEVSEVHAVTRLRAGFDLNQVISEFTLLRDAILGCWESVSTTARQQGSLRVLNSAIDKAIVASVEHYTQAQHSTLGALDRISAVALESRTLDDFLDRLLRVVLDTMATVDTAAVMLLEDDTLWVRAAVGLEEEVEAGFGLPLGEGFAGRIAAERRPLLLTAGDVEASVKSDILRRRGIRALYGVPLTQGEELVGVVHVGSLTAPGFSEQDRLLLDSMASRATAAIVQHGLRAAAEMRSRQQSAVAELGAFGLLCEEPQRVMERAVALVNEVLAPDVVAVEQLDPTGTLTVRAQTGGWPSLWPVTPGSQAEHVLAAAQPVIVHDYRTETRFAYPPLLRERDILAAVMVSIRAPGERPGRPYGIIGTYSRRRRIFSSEDVVFLQTISSIVASAILRGQSAEALRDSEERLRLAIEVAELGTFDWNLITGDMLWSGRTREMFGVPDDAPISRESWAARIHPDDRARVLGLIEAAMNPAAGGPAYVAEYRTLPTEGSSERWISDQGQVLFEPDGRPLRYIGIAKDITEGKRVELERERLLRELEQAVQFRKDILAIVSHDLRSPLAAINLSASLLARRALAGSEARVHKQLETILRASGRMEHLIGDLLDMANIQAGKLSIELGTCRATALVDEAVEFHAPAAAAKGVGLEGQVLVEDATVCCDHDRIQQALSNLLSNAIKFSDSGATVSLRAEHEDGRVRFTIVDHGPGIAPEALAHIFKPYWSAEGRAKRGTGLGLFITRGIVEAHGGQLWAESRLGEGSAFHFTLPVADSGSVG